MAAPNSITGENTRKLGGTTYVGTATTDYVGFFGATPVVRQAHIADATDAATAITKVNAVIACLETFGLTATA